MGNPILLAYHAAMTASKVSAGERTIILGTLLTNATSFIAKSELPDKGVKVHVSGGRLVIDLHIVVTYGMNIAAIVQSIINKVRYTVEEATGLTVKKVNVFVDGIQPE